MKTVQTLEISLKSKKYNIFLGNNLLNQIDCILKNHLTSKNIVILYDKVLKDKLNIWIIGNFFIMILYFNN